ncbi:glycosyltransferase [Chamaesiphon polymorphus]|uniref:Glycoside hydrolase n=1 Tax=Chamaesiphon polymorphus CCALA 037 TaxID=2107692 RepID=A0A2T1GKC9_9CYAN|nr:glycoside hydrolase [Chamaesiphon polymorphus CCALA 037]
MGNSIVAPNRRPSYALIAVDSDPTAEIGKVGGSQNVYVRELGLGLARRGCQVDIFTRREHPEQEEIVENSPGCRTIRLTAGPAKFIPRDELFEHLPAFVDAWWLFQLRSGRNYTLIHSNYWLSGWVGLRLKSHLGIPQVHTYHSVGVVKYQSMAKPPAIAVTRHLVETACLTSTDCAISTSPQEVADLRQLISDRGRVRVIPYAINTSHFGSIARTVAREHLKIATDEKLILYVGRFDRRKGIETLIKACATLTKPFRLYLVGGDRTSEEECQERQRIQDLVTELGLEDATVFVGQVAQTELPFYYAAANVCVIPSDYEPFGLVALEAMAAGTPVIASIVGGLKYTVIHRETGMLIPPNEPTALAAAITEVFDDPWQWEAYGQAGRQWVRDNFSAAEIVAEIHSLYQSLTLAESVQSACDTQKLNPSLKLVSRFIE